jgi:hypothetical protein
MSSGSTHRITTLQQEIWTVRITKPERKLKKKQTKQSMADPGTPILNPMHHVLQPVGKSSFIH